MSLSDSRTFCVTALILGVTASAYISRIKVSVPAPSGLDFQGAVPVLIDVNGRLQNVYVVKGSVVRAGDVLIQLDTRDLLLKRNDLESQIHSAERDRTDASRLSSLYREFQQVELDLGRFTITSPLDGKVMSVASLHPGEMLQAGSAVAVLVPDKN